MVKYPHLTRSPKKGIWRYRRGVPHHLRLIVGRREIVKTFGSVNQDEILLDYHIFSAETDEAFERAELLCEAWGPDGEEPSGEIIFIDMSSEPSSGSATANPLHLCTSPYDRAALTAQHYEWCKDAEQKFRLETTRRVTADPEAFWRGDIVPLPMSQAAFYALPQFSHMAGTGDGYKYLLALAYAKRLEDAAVLLKAKLATQDVEAIAADFGSCMTCAKQYGLALIEAQLRVANHFLTSNEAFVPSPPPAPAVPVSAAPSGSQPKTGPPLSVAVQQWISSQSRGRSAWSSERRALCQRVMTDFIELCGDKGLGDYRKSDGRTFVELLRRLPANLEKKRASLGLEGKGLREIADIAELKALAPQDDSNTNKKIGIVHQCFSWLNKQFDECGASPVAGMKISIKTNVKEEKDTFSIEQLNAIFAAPIFTGCVSEKHWSQPGHMVLRASAKFWVPLIALFSGMRLGEICQLTRAHVRCHDGTHYFALTHELRLKNPASVRSVPVHHKLVQCGFLDFVVARDGVLFPELTQHTSGRWSDAFGKHFARFMKSIGMQRDKTDFHSFRHSFVAAADACGIEFAARERIIGHALQGQAGRYGKSFKQEQSDMQVLLTRNRQLQALHFHGLELKHLENFPPNSRAGSSDEQVPPADGAGRLAPA